MRPDHPSEEDVIFYRVEQKTSASAGCECENCKCWTVCYNDGTEDVEIGTSWQGEDGREQASDICDLMNMAYNAGIEATQVTPAYDCRSAVECKRVLSDGKTFVPPPGWVYSPDLQRDADRYRFLRRAEAELGPKEEDAFAAMWRELVLKGTSSRFDWIVDDGRQRCAETAAMDEEASDE